MPEIADPPQLRDRLGRALGTERFDGDALAAWAFAFASVFYLGMQNGGFDTVVSGQFGILVWWGVLLMAVVGLIPRLTTLGWVALGMLLAMAAWTAIGLGVSESQERTLAEVGRVATYAGVLVLGLTAQARAGSRPIVNGLASAIAAITIVSVASRLHPAWFPHNDQIDFLGSATRRLSYPLNYWNALATFMAIGFALLLGVATTSRSLVGKALAFAVLPVSCLGVYLCVSRGGVILLVLGALLYLAFTDDRLPKLATTAIAGAGGGLLILAASSREAVQSGLDTVVARDEGGEMIWLSIGIAAAVALACVGVDRLARHHARPDWTRVSRRTATIATAAVATVLLAGAIGAGGIGKVEDRWESFKTPPEIAGDVTQANAFARLQDSAGQGRYQYWQQAVDAFESEPLLGTGGATFVLWWARHASVGGSVQDAHNLYVQTLGEIGIPGAMALLAFVVLTLFAGVRLALRTTGDARALSAAALAGAVTFWVDATVEWVWQMPALAVVMMLLAAVLLGSRGVKRRSPLPRWPRAGLAMLAIVALLPVMLATAVSSGLERSQAAVRAGDLRSALVLARSAADVQAGAAGPRLQEALVLEEAGQLPQALAATGAAIEREPTNWQPWLIRARIAERIGRHRTALRAFRTAHRLNPQSEVFAGCRRFEDDSC